MARLELIEKGIARAASVDSLAGYWSPNIMVVIRTLWDLDCPPGLGKLVTSSYRYFALTVPALKPAA
jgi:hypothetical protein